MQIRHVYITLEWSSKQTLIQLPAFSIRRPPTPQPCIRLLSRLIKNCPPPDTWFSWRGPVIITLPASTSYRRRTSTMHNSATNVGLPVQLSSDGRGWTPISTGYLVRLGISLKTNNGNIIRLESCAWAGQSPPKLVSVAAEHSNFPKKNRFQRHTQET